MRLENKAFEDSFSVLMSVYQKDNPNLFDRALASLVSQTILPQQIVIVSDGPLTHELEVVLENYSKLYCGLLKVLRLEKNCGLSSALNFGLTHIGTDWVARADADDINHVDRFYETAKILNQNPEVSLVGSAINECNLNGEVLQVKMPPLRHDDIVSYCRIRNPFNHMTVSYRLDAVLDVGGYPNIFLREDYGLWIKMLASGCRSINTAKILVNATTGDDFFIRRGGIRYATGEVVLQKLLVECGIKSKFIAFFHGAIRASIFAGPAVLRRVFYQRFLR